MDGIARLLTNENIDLVFSTFNFYLPPLYASILHEIEMRERTPQLAMVVGYTDRRVLPILLSTYLQSECKPETRRLLSLNRIQWMQVPHELVVKVQRCLVTTPKIFKLVGIMNSTGQVESVLVFVPRQDSTFDQFIKCIEVLEQTCTTTGEWYKLMNYNILCCSTLDIQQAIEYENVLHKYCIETNSLNL